MASGNQIKFGVGYQVDKASIEKVKQSLRDLQNIKIGNFKGTEEQLQNVQKTAKIVETALQKAFNPTLNTANIETFNTILKQSGRTIDTVYADFAKLGSQGRQAFTQVASQIMTTNAQLRETKSLLTTMGETMMNTIKWGIASSVMNTFTSSVRQAFEYVKNLDSALTDIRIVTGDSTQKMKEFAVQANQAAQALGRSTMDYSKAALTFYQQGLSDQDVQARTQATLVAQNITGAGQEMADYLTAVWNGYKVANEEAELYVDKLAAVADSSASNMSQLATAMSKVASTANMLGVPVDKLNAQIATITATTRQAPETVGNALKTIYARINDIATGADDAQISLGNYSEKMAEVGFSVLDANGKLRDTGDVIDEIGAKWSTLSREQQIYLARTMAGQRQYNNLLALFENWGKYTDLVTISMDAQGASMEKNERYMDSLAAKMEQFGAAGERVKSALVNENDLKGITDFGTKAVNIFASLIEGIGGGGNAMLALGSIATSVFGNIIGKQIGNMIIKSQQAKASYQAMAEAIQNTSKMKLSAAYQDQNNVAFRNYVNNLQEIQKTWSVLTLEEKQEQQQNVKNIATWAEDRQALVEVKQAAQDFVNAISKKSINLDNGITESLKRKIEGLFPVIEDAKEKLGSLYYIEDAGLIAKRNPAIQIFKNQLQSIIKTLGRGSTLGQEGQGLIKQLQYIYENGRKAGVSLEDVSNRINNFLERTQKVGTDVLNINNINNEIKQFDSKIKIVQDRFNQLNEQAKTIFNVQSIIKFASGIGQIASTINTVVNLTRTWKNENISVGEKLLQTFTTIGFMLPMFISGLNNIKTALGLNVVLEKTNLQIKRQQLIAQQSIAMQKRLSNLEQKKQTLGLTEEELLEYDILQTKLAQNTADGASISLQKTKLILIKEQLLTSIKNAGTAIMSFLSGPGGIILAIGALATVIGVSLYKAWNKAKEAAQQATKQMQAANDVYKQSKDNLNELKSSLESLKNAKNSLNELTTGTEEWKSALEDVNNQVIELLEKYPQLAENGRIITNSNGMLQISEEGQQYLLNQQRQATQANAMGYLSSRQKNDQANREYKVTQLSRKLGLGAFDSSILDKTITAYQEYGDQIFTNTKELQNLIGANDKQIAAIDEHKTEIIALAKELTANTTATQSLTQSIITGTFINPDDIAKSINPEIYAAQYAKNVTNANLNWSKYGGQSAESYFQTLPSDNPDNIAQFMANSDETQSRIIDGIYYDDQALQNIANRYKQINSSTIEEIEISGDKIYETLKGTSEKTELAFKDMVAAVIAADLDTEEISKKSEQFAQKYENLFGDQATTIYKIGQGTLAAGEASIQDYYKFLENQDLFDVLTQQTGLQSSEIRKRILNLQHETGQALKTYIESLPVAIGQALKSLDPINNDIPYNTTLSEYAQKIIGQSLQNAWKNGTYDEYLDILNSLETEDLQDFVTFIDSLGEDINSIDTNSFINKMKELGISTENVAEQQVQELINKLKELNGIDIDVQDNIGQLYEGATSFLEKYSKDANATLSKSEFESLSQIASNLDLDLSEYFTQTWKGTYKLKTTAEDFVEIINGITLNKFEQKIKEAENKVNNLQEIQQIKTNTGITGQNLASYINDSATLHNNNDYYNSLGTNVFQTGAQVLASLEIPEISNNEYIEELLEGGRSAEAVNFLLENIQLIVDGWNQVGDNLSKAESELELYKEQQQDATTAQEEWNQQLEEWNQQRRQALLDSDVNVDQWHDLSEYLQENADKLDEIDDSLIYNKEAAEELAEEMLRFASAIEEVQQNYDNWNEILTSGSIQQQVQAGNELKNVYSDILNLPFESLSSDFTQNAENLQYLQTILYGDEEAAQAAYDTLALLAQQDIEARVGINDASLADFDTTLDTLRATINNGIGDLQIGAEINDADAIMAMNQLINAADMTAQQASDLLASMGVDAEIEEVAVPSKDHEELINAITPTETTQEIQVPNLQKTLATGSAQYTPLTIPTFTYDYSSTSQDLDKTHTATALRVKSARKSSGGNIGVKRSKAPSAGKSSGGGGGGGSKGGGGSAKQPTTAKISTDTISTKQKQTPYNPYEQIEKSYERQEDLLKDLDELEKHLQGEDRLNNIQQQNKELIKQNSIIEERQKISKDAAEQGTTAWYRNQLLADEALKNVVRFDSDGQVNETVSKQAITNAFNTQLAAQKAYYEAAQNNYNNWVENVWNKYSGEQQQANKKQKQQYDEDLKNAKKNAQDKIKIAEEEYNDRTKLLENYQKALEEDNKFYEQYLDNIEKLIENRIAESKIKVDLAFDFGQTERQWQEFENKFIKRLQKDDIFVNAKASFRELQSYFNSSEITQAQKEIDKVRKEIALIQSGQYSSIYGITQQEFNNLSETDRNNLQKRFLDQATKDLQDYQKKLMDSLEEVQDKQEEIQELYLDSIDKAKDKMDDVVSQYERINDLVEHNIKLTELLYGDNAGYDIRDSYYNRQSLNNSRMIQTLRQQQAYWQNQLNNATPGTEDWNRFKQNLENVTDAINSALENQLDLLATKFENKIQGALANIQNKLTNGLGNAFLDSQWDYISKDDSAFLDVVNSKFGIDEVEKLYSDAAAGAEGNITQQQRINKLMNDQLKLLREKDKLTQYDIDRAKAALEVEKARMALEDARNNKSKMRLRRDSQGNYTYQYVADEEKLSDLQSALADAESQLYNMDKEHYQQQLNQMYNTYKDYLEKRADLEREMQATQDENERARIQARIKLLEEAYTEYADNITDDLQFTLSNYLTESAAAGLGVDLSQYSTAEQIDFLKDNLPYVNTEIQNLADTLTGQNGIFNTTKQYLDELTAAFDQYNQEVEDTLSLTGTSVLSIASTIDDQAIARTEEWLGLYQDAALETQNIIQSMQQLLEEMQKFMNEDFSSSDVIQSLYRAEQMLEKIFNPDQIDDTTTLAGSFATIGYGTLGADQDIGALTNEQKQELQSLQADYLTQQADFNTLADELALADINAYTENILANADEILDSIYNAYKDDLKNRLEHLLLQEVNSLSGITSSVSDLNNSQTLDQNVAIEAHFPNVTNHTEIEEAFNNLVNMASQKAATQRT